MSDTEPTNTGRLNGVITQPQNYFWPLQYEPCSMHVLDLILKHQFLSYFSEKITSLELPFDFNKKITAKWE